MAGKRIFPILIAFLTGWPLFATAAPGTENNDGFTLSPTEGPDGTLYCAEGDSLSAWTPDGQLIWRRLQPSLSSPPLVSGDGSLYLISGGSTISVYTPDDSLRWSRPGFSYGITSPALGANDILYFPDRDAWMAVNPDGKYNWRKEPLENLYSSSAAVGGDGTVYITGINSDHVYALNPDGTLKWTYAFDTVYLSPISLDYQGNLYILCASRLISLSSGGSLRWSVENENWYRFTGTPVVAAGGTIYATDESGAISIFTSGGKFIQSLPTGAVTRTGPLLGNDGMLYQCSFDGRLFRADPLTGAVTLLHETGRQIQAPPIITSTGLICFGVIDGALQTFHPDGLSGYAPDAPWPCPDGNNRRTRSLVIPPSLGGIAGTVREFSTGEPCIRVAIRVSPGDYRAVSDSTGYFRLTGIPEGVYQVTAEGFGIVPRTIEGITVSPGAVSETAIDVSHDRKWIRWTHPLGGYPGGTPAIGEGGAVYLGTASGLVYALNPDRTVRWSLQTEGSVTPVVIGYDGNLFFGSGNTLWSTDTEGNVRWQFTAGSSIFSPVTGRDGTVYFGCIDGNMYAVDADGALKWKTPVSGIYTPVIGADGTLYAGLQSGVLLSLDPYGKIKWSYPVGAAVVGSPILGPDGTIYVAAGQRMYALDPAGKLQWIYYLAEGITCGPVMDADEKIYFGTGANLFVISKLRLVWSYSLDAEITAIPAVGSDGIVYFGTASGRFYALTFEGNLTWKLDIASTPRHGAALSPAGVLYFGTESGELFAIQTRSYGYPQGAPWPRQGKNDGNRAAADPPPHAATLAGTVTDSGGNTGIPGIVLRLTPGDITGMTDSRGQYTLFVPEPGTYSLEASASGWLPAQRAGISLAADGHRTVNISLHPDAVSMKWKLYIQPYPFNRTITPAIGSDGTIYLNAPGNLLAINPEGGVEWKMSIGSSLSSSPTVSSDGTIFMPGDAVLCSISSNGVMNWSQSYPGAGQFMTVALVADSILYASNTDYADRFVRAIWADTGEQKWRVRSLYSTNPIFDPPVAGSDGTLYFGDSGTGFYAVSPENHTDWMYATPYAVDAPSAIGPDNTLYIVQRNGALSAITPKGKLRWTYQGGYESLGSCIVGPDTTAYYVDGQGILAALDAGGKVKWSRSGLLRCAIPALGSDSTLYVAGNEGKLLALALDGALKWSYDVGSDIRYAPKLAPDGTLYLYGTNGYLYALRTPSRGYPRERCWPCLFGNNRNTSHLAPEIARGSIAGLVTSDRTGAGIPNALVSLSPGDLTVSTDAEGRFILPNLKQGGYALNVSASGYTARKDLWTEIIGGGRIELGFSLADIIVEAEEKDAPRAVSLLPNYPNPFNPSTTISFTLPVKSPVRLTIYDTAGRRVAELANRIFPAGNHSVTWNAAGCASGVYFYKIEAGAFTETRKMLFMK